MPEQRPVALVTGAARGIGARTAVLLAERGWSLGLLDACQDNSALAYPLARQEDLRAVAEEAKRAGADALQVVAYDRDPHALRAAVSLVGNALVASMPPSRELE